MYHNTTAIKGQQLKDAQANVKEQETLIAQIYEQLEPGASPWEMYLLANTLKLGYKFKSLSLMVTDMRSWPVTRLHNGVKQIQSKGEQIPITSVRRAITNLTNSRFLTKTSKSRKGALGKKEYIWKH